MDMFRRRKKQKPTSGGRIPIPTPQDGHQYDQMSRQRLQLLGVSGSPFPSDTDCVRMATPSVTANVANWFLLHAYARLVVDAYHQPAGPSEAGEMLALSGGVLRRALDAGPNDHDSEWARGNWHAALLCLWSARQNFDGCGNQFDDDVRARLHAGVPSALLAGKDLMRAQQARIPTVP